MTDVALPPPPPPPPVPSAAGYDFLRPFVFLFDDPQWLPKVLIGGVFVLFSTFVVGIPFLLGYLAKLTRNVIAGDPTPLPAWTDLGELFGEGLVLFGVVLVYTLPASILSILIAIPAALTGASEQAAIRDIGGGIFGCASCVVSLVSFATTLILPAAILMTITTRRFGAAFDLRRVWSFISANMGNYLLALVVEVIAWMLSLTGLILLCVGVIFTQFWGAIVTAYAFAQVYRTSPVKS
ncbi:MAG: DUF4013 domain-containing protein [Thermoanaerobaculia bacterium]